MPTTTNGSGDIFALLAQDHALFETRLKALSQAADALSRFERDDAARAVIASALDFFETEGARHEELEEATLFPRVRPLPQFEQTLKALEFQHGMNRDIGAKLRACLDRFGPGKGSELLRLAQRFTEMHRAHAMGEERALFPLAASVLSPATIEEMGRGLIPRAPTSGLP